MPDEAGMGSPCTARERCVAVQPVDVLPGGDQQRCGVVGAHAVQREGGAGDIGNERVELPVVRGQRRAKRLGACSEQAT